MTARDTTEGAVTAGIQSVDVAAAKPAHHLSVCICTFKRAEFLGRLLASLANQRTEGLFSYSIVVADNDGMQSGRPVVDEFSSRSPLPVTYCVEPQQNIALVRNKALAFADGDFAVFIDDDEFPTDDWLHNLLQTCLAYGVDGVLGPVNPFFDREPPRWVKKGGFFERPNYATGYQLTWAQCRTGNVLFRKNILDGVDTPFRSEFDTAGEDMDFFRRMMNKGCAFIWCNDAVVHEVVPAARCNLSFLLKRALLRGSNFPKHPTGRLRNFLRSAVAVPSYLLALPILAIFGQHVFFKYLVKLCDHVSRILAFAGWSVVKERQT
jgi:succinoglycan biosynthesis protein ExoM